MTKQSIVLCLFVILMNVLEILSLPPDWKDDHNSVHHDTKHEYHKAKGRSWEYGTKIEHPAPKHGYHHKGHDFHTHKDGGKGWTHISDTGDKHGGHYGGHYEKPHIPEFHSHIPEIPIHIPPVHTIPIHIPKYETDLEHHYQPKHDYEHKHYPIPVHITKHVHYEPKHEEPKKDSLDKLTDFNVDGIIDDIQKDLKKSSNYVS